jgi:hypothetical protein
MLVRWVVVVTAVAATSCAAVPEAPEDRQLLDVDAASGRVSTTSRAPLQFTVEFGDHAVRMPQRILVDGVNLVGTGSCPTESGIGIGLYPVLDAVAPALGGADATGSLTVTLAGPTIARVTVDWAAPYTCNGSQQRAHGTSTFTIFPNGRIVRNDTAKPTETTFVNDTVNDCGCGGPSNFFFTSFWMFSLGQTVMPNGSPLTDAAMAGCVMYQDHAIGVAWPDTSTRILMFDGGSAFVHDWLNDSDTLPAIEREVTSAIMLSKQIAPTNCGDILANLDDFPIMVAGSAVVTDDGGIYLDPRQHSDPVVISAPRRVPRGFAVSLDVGGFAEVTRSPEAEGDWYATQPDGDRTVFWFRDGLGVGETISIDPQ